MPYYPINDYGPLMKGLVIGGLGIFHIFVAQFAIGGGLLMCWFQRAAQNGRCRPARRFVDGYFKTLVLISFVLGALTGVGMWFISVQVSPRTIGMMIDEFHWLWATEWTFFCLEIVSGYAFYRYGEKLDDRARMRLLVLYAFAAWASLFWINGIISWQLTPGAWAAAGGVWAGMFNPSFWPSLFFRTVASMAGAALIAGVVVHLLPEFSRAERIELLRQAAYFLLPTVLLPIFVAWFLYVIPADSRSWVLGGAAPMTMFFALGVGAAVLIALYAVLALLRRDFYVNLPTAVLLCLLAMGVMTGAEFVREGVRKPYTIRNTLFSNSVTEEEVAGLRKTGSVAADPYPLRNPERYPNAQVRLGAKVFRFQCSICHTEDGANGLTHLTGSWSLEQQRLNIADLRRTKPFMPPFLGNAAELEALVQMISWLNAGRPREWPASDDPQNLARLERLLQCSFVGPERESNTGTGTGTGRKEKAAAAENFARETTTEDRR